MSDKHQLILHTIRTITTDYNHSLRLRTMPNHHSTQILIILPAFSTPLRVHLCQLGPLIHTYLRLTHTPRTPHSHHPHNNIPLSASIL
jgi:hypothetical protein